MSAGMAVAPAEAPLTIDTNRLGDLFLPSYVIAAAAVDVTFKAFKAAHRRGPNSKTCTGMNRAHTVCESDLARLAEIIRDRGGLLLIGGAQCSSK